MTGKRRSIFSVPLNVHSKERNEEIDLALAVMASLQAPGQCVSYDAIAEITGLSHEGPKAIVQRALIKLRRRMSKELRTELAA